MVLPITVYTYCNFPLSDTREKSAQATGTFAIFELNQTTLKGTIQD